jgi:hypothetical protein
MFMGSNAVSLPFFDGHRCVGGPTVRWPVKNSGPGATMIYGPGLAAHAAANFSPTFQLMPGSTWRFQGWYRNNSGPCGTGANSSNSGTVVFTY